MTDIKTNWGLEFPKRCNPQRPAILTRGNTVIGRSVSKTPLRVTAGPWHGHFIRRARKPGSCAYYKAGRNGGWCNTPINTNDLYLEGEPDTDSPSPWATKRYCLECAGPDARRALTMSDRPGTGCGPDAIAKAEEA